MESFNDPFRSLVVYCLLKINENEFLPLNREYKPIGLMDGEFVNYEDFKFLFIPANEINFNILFIDRDYEDHKFFHLFTDSTYPGKKTTKDRYINMVIKTLFDKTYPFEFEKAWAFKEKYSWKEYVANLKRIKRNEPKS